MHQICMQSFRLHNTRMTCINALNVKIIVVPKYEHNVVLRIKFIHSNGDGCM